MDEQRGAFCVVHCVMLRAVLVGLALLSLFVPPWVQAGNRFHERNHTGLLALYGFDDGQRSSDLHPTTARDYTGLDLLGSLTTSTSSIEWEEDLVGFSIPHPGGGARAVSQKTSANLLKRLRDEFSIEIFVLSPPNVGSGNVLVAGFGDWSPGSPFPACESGFSSVEGGWRIFTMPGNSINFQAVTLFEDSPACFQSGIGISPDTLRHAVFRGRAGEVGLYSHGATSSSANAGIVFDPLLWARHTAHLTFAIPTPTEAWTGSVFMFAMFDRYMSNDEAAQNRIYGLPNSLAVATASSLAVTEDVAVSLFP